MNKQNILIASVVVIGVVLAFVVTVFMPKSTPSPDNTEIDSNRLIGEQTFEELAEFSNCTLPSDGSSVAESLAKCLAEKKVTMYGAEWCSHCKTQKALFGEAFKFIPYVECPDNISLCIEKGIEGYPTWLK